MSYFPMFIELQDKNCLIVGGGQIALHKVRVLRDFGAKLTVVAVEISPEIKETEGVDWRERCFEPEDIKNQELVVAATDNKEQNHKISLLCQKEQIPVNAVDQIEDCSFIFPAYLKEGEVVAAFSSGGQSPVVTQYLKKQMRPILTELIGTLAAQLGGLRERVKQMESKEARKTVYQTLFQKGLEQTRQLSEEEIEKVIGGK